MKPGLIAQVGITCFGPQWTHELARRLGVSDRTVRRWANGSAPIPENVRSELFSITMNKLHIVNRMLDELAATPKAPGSSEGQGPRP